MLNCQSCLVCYYHHALVGVLLKSDLKANSAIFAWFSLEFAQVSLSLPCLKLLHAVIVLRTA